MEALVTEDLRWLNFRFTAFYEVRPRKKCPPGMCIARFRASSMVQVRSGAPAPRKRQTRREAGAQSPRASLLSRGR
jgi:hypothetical protein